MIAFIILLLNKHSHIDHIVLIPYVLMWNAAPRENSPQEVINEMGNFFWRNIAVMVAAGLY